MPNEEGRMEEKEPQVSVDAAEQEEKGSALFGGPLTYKRVPPADYIARFVGELVAYARSSTEHALDDNFIARRIRAWQAAKLIATFCSPTGHYGHPCCADCANALAAARAENEKLREALAHYVNAVNWMSHTDADAMLRVWIGSGDGPDYARRALAAQEGMR